MINEETIKLWSSLLLRFSKIFQIWIAKLLMKSFDVRVKSFPCVGNKRYCFRMPSLLQFSLDKKNPRERILAFQLENPFKLMVISNLNLGVIIWFAIWYPYVVKCVFLKRWTYRAHVPRYISVTDKLLFSFSIRLSSFYSQIIASTKTLDFSYVKIN